MVRERWTSNRLEHGGWKKLREAPSQNASVPSIVHEGVTEEGMKKWVLKKYQKKTLVQNNLDIKDKDELDITDDPKKGNSMFQ